MLYKDGSSHGGWDWRRIGWIAAAVTVLGSLIGVGAGLLTLALYGVERLALGYVEGTTVAWPYDVAPLRRVVAILGGSIVASIIWWLLRAKTIKVPSVKTAVAGERMPWWQTIVHVLLQIFIVGCGSSIGREVAPRELGALFGQRFGGIAKLNDDDRRMIVAVAAGAGLAGVYDAPLAGLFFAVEILLADVTIEKVALALGASSVAAFIASMIKGQHVFYDISLMPESIRTGITPSLMLFAVLGGVLFGLAGALFRRGSQWAESGKPKGAGILWMMPAAALLTGVVAIWVPQIMGNGRASAQLAFNDSAGPLQTVLPIIVISFVAKALITVLAIRSGASGGVLQPGIALGALMGSGLGLLWVLAFPTDSVTACSLIGAAALLAASQQAPLMAMCLVMELTAAPMALFVPVGAAVAVSALVSSHFGAAISRSQRKAA